MSYILLASNDVVIPNNCIQLYQCGQVNLLDSYLDLNFLFVVKKNFIRLSISLFLNNYPYKKASINVVIDLLDSVSVSVFICRRILTGL
jgi:hypothetical protein